MIEDSFDVNAVAQRFQSVLADLAMTQSGVARHLNMSRSYVNQVCGGKVAPGPKLLVWLAQEHNVSLSWLLVGIGPRSILGDAPTRTVQRVLPYQVDDALKEAEGALSNLRRSLGGVVPLDILSQLVKLQATDRSGRQLDKVRAYTQGLLDTMEVQ